MAVTSSRGGARRAASVSRPDAAGRRRWYGRLKRRGEIAFVRRRGRVASLPTLVAYGAGAPASEPKFAFSVSTGVGNAVVRNLIRRRFQGALDALGSCTVGCERILIVAKPEAAGAPYRRLEGDVLAALARLAAPAR